jgi:hypothetical protein
VRATTLLVISVAAMALTLAGCSGGSGPAALGVGGVSSASLAQRGIYLGPPGHIPAGTPREQRSAPPTTAVDKQTGGTLLAPGSEQQAVRGDPANGIASVSEQAALATAVRSVGGFVGYVVTGTPVLVQFDDIYTSVVATAWAIPFTGGAQLSAGPAPTGPGAGSQVTSQPGSTTAIVFVDAVTGKLISEEGFTQTR